MSAVVIDYETQPGDPHAWPAEIVGAAVYVAPREYGWPKAVNRAQVDAIVGTGRKLLFIHEANVADFQGGTIAGAHWGRGFEVGMEELGLGLDAPATLTFDTAIPPSAFATALAYLLGFRGALAPARTVVQAYGEGALIEYLVAHGAITMGWESESTSFPGNNTPTAHTTLRQIYGRTVAGLGGAYDYNEVLAYDWGGWPRPATSPKPPPSSPKADPMLYRVPNTDHAVSINENGDIILLNGVQAVALHDFGTHETDVLKPFKIIPSNEGRYQYRGATAAMEGTQYVLRQLFQHPDTGAVVERIYVLH